MALPVVRHPATREAWEAMGGEVKLRFEELGIVDPELVVGLMEPHFKGAQEILRDFGLALETSPLA